MAEISIAEEQLGELRGKVAIVTGKHHSCNSLSCEFLIVWMQAVLAELARLSWRCLAVMVQKSLSETQIRRPGNHLRSH